METFLTVVSWLAPPVIGAFIGYWTNRIAIRMLFRPLRAKRLGPIPIPLTPGIVPRNRHSLAIAVGDMVANELLSPEMVQEQIGSPAFRDDLTVWIREQTPSLLRILPIDRLSNRLIAFFAIKAPELCQVMDVQKIVTDQINRFEAEQIEHMIREVTGKHLKWINWFGAMLGAIIGCLQLALRAF